MRTLNFLLILSTVFSISLFSNQTYKVDLDKSNLKWIGEKVSGDHWGNVSLKSGEAILNDKGELIGGNFVVDMNSLTVGDLEPGEWHDKLLGHLKSDDFFSVKDHDEAIFVITNIKKLDGNKAKITGNLTIKDITKQITFDAEHSVKGNVYTADAKIIVDRTKFDIKYRSGNFFEDLGDKLIYDDFIINLKLVAKS